MVGERETSAHAASPTWPQGWEKEKTGVFPRQGCDWEASTSEECMTSPQLLILITTTLWGLNSNLFTFSLLSWLLVNALLYCIASFISKPDQKKFSLALFLWLFVNFKALQDYAEKERYFHPWSEIDSFLSPKCFKKIINKRQSNSRQDRWMWSFCFGWCWQCWALAVYFAWVKCWTKCYFHRDTMCVYVCMCMYACMYVNIFMLLMKYFKLSPKTKCMCIQLRLRADLYLLQGAEDPHGYRCRMCFLTCYALLQPHSDGGCIRHHVPERSLSNDDWLCRRGDV